MGHRQNGESSSLNDGWSERWQDFQADDRGHGLEMALEEGLSWVRSRSARIYNAFYERLRGRSRGRGGGSGAEEDRGYDFEMREEG